MGLLTDIRSGKRDRFGAGALVFWLLAGAAGGAASDAYSVGGTGNAMVIAASIGAALGLCVGAYAAFGNSQLARGLAIPGLLIETLAMFLI